MKTTSIDLRTVTIRPLSTPDEKNLWNKLVKEQHYLASSGMYGEQMRYVAEHNGKWMACLGVSAGTLKSKLRSEWLEWSPIQEKQRLHLVVQNSRFLVLKDVSVPNLASRCLSLLVRRVSKDWEENYGHPVYLMETFVDQERPGTCYKASGWQEIGMTKGFRREAKGYVRHGIKKSYWVFPVRKNAQKLLGSPKTLDDKPLPSIDIKLLPLDNEKKQQSIQDVLLEYFPEKKGKKRTGNPYSTSIIVGLTLTGMVCGIKDSENIAAWSKKLEDKYKRALKCPYREVKGVFGYQTPSANTIRYALQDIDARVLEEAMIAWTRLCGINTENTILALDGKVLCGAKTEDERAPNHVALYDVKSGIVVDQELVPNKTSEVSVARDIFDRNNISGSLITVDAAHTTPKTGDAILKKKADFIFTVKNNQPKLFDALEEKFNSNCYRKVDIKYNSGHGRNEKRTIEAISVDPSDPIVGNFNGVRQIIRITRSTENKKTYETERHVVYAICSRSSRKLNVLQLAQTIRGHWSIEVRLHGQRDVRMGEDSNKTHIGAAPRALACLRNWVVAIIERHQRSNTMRRISQAWQDLCYSRGKAIQVVSN